MDRNTIYHMNCEVDSCPSKNIGNYDGETLRPTHFRYMEHYRAASNPTAKSYVDKSWAIHYATNHPNCREPKIGLKIVDKASSTNERKIKESRIILKNKCDLNDRDEQAELKQFLV